MIESNRLRKAGPSLFSTCPCATSESFTLSRIKYIHLRFSPRVDGKRDSRPDWTKILAVVGPGRQTSRAHGTSLSAERLKQNPNGDHDVAPTPPTGIAGSCRRLSTPLNGLPPKLLSCLQSMDTTRSKAHFRRRRFREWRRRTIVEKHLSGSFHLPWALRQVSGHQVPSGYHSCGHRSRRVDADFFFSRLTPGRGYMQCRLR